MMVGSLGGDADDIPPEKVRVWEELAGQVNKANEVNEVNEVNEGEYWRMGVKRGVLRVQRQGWGAKWERAPFGSWVEEGLWEGVGNPRVPEGCWVESRLVVPDLAKVRS
jgi:hypothetical protein